MLKPGLHGLVYLAVLLVIGGCSGLGVKPWDRDLLADPMMEIGADALRIAVDEHIYFSKEATSGGRGFGGGGCGCN
jgi:hypothetical protein